MTAGSPGPAPTYDTILFDIDGTLCDPGKSIIECARYALATFGIQETDETKLRRFVGPPLEHAFRDYYGFDVAQTARAVAYFRGMMRREGIQLYTAYPGIRELLGELKQSGRQLAIVTSKIDCIARESLAKTGLIGFFEFISAQQPDIVVNKRDILVKALSELHITNNSGIVMIGDRRHDIEAANANNIDSIGVLWGYGDSDELHNEGATHIVADTNELKQLLLNCKD